MQQMTVSPVIKEALEAHCRGLIRNATGSKEMTYEIIIRQLEAIRTPNPDVKIMREFIEIQQFYNTPVIEKIVVSDAQTEFARRKIVSEFLKAEIENCRVKRAELSKSWRKSRGSIPNLFSSSKKLAFWVSIEFPIKEFMDELKNKNYSLAYKKLFEQKIPDDVTCYALPAEAQRSMTNNATFLSTLYYDCLIPLRIQILVNATTPPTTEVVSIKLNALNPTDLSILTCILGNNNFKQVTVEEGKVSKRQHENIDEKLLKSIMSNEVVHERDKLLNLTSYHLKQTNNDNDTKEKCTLS